MIGQFDDQLATIGRALQGAATSVVKVVIIVEGSDGVDGDGVFGAVAIRMTVTNPIECEVLAIDGIAVLALFLQDLVEN